MKVAVVGLWHLGTVTAAGCASAGHEVVAFDEPRVVDELRAGRWPVAEPGLPELAAEAAAAGRLRFSAEPRDLQDAAVVWITYDTPVDDEDRADVGFVVGRVEALFPHLAADALVLLSSQLPIGSTRRLAEAYAARFPGRRPRFACSPENLRLGKALEVFLEPDRVIVGAPETDRPLLGELFGRWTERIEWMSVASAEMTKHAINAFLATSVVFTNELATLCEQTGANAREVERGLKTEARIGPRAYVRPGGPFAGGTLARDIGYLLELGTRTGVATHLFAAVRTSNDLHKGWAGRRLAQLLGALEGRTIAVLGLTYKAGTNTLRRSAAVETCRWLRQHGVRVRAFDPAVAELPPEHAGVAELVTSIEAAVRGCDAVLIATALPEFQRLAAAELAAWLPRPLVLDPEGVAGALGQDKRIRYVTVGSETCSLPESGR